MLPCANDAPPGVPVRTTPAPAPTRLRFFVWTGVLCWYGTEGMACAAGHDEDHARSVLVDTVIQRGLREPWTREEIEAHFKEVRPVEVVFPSAFFVEASAG